MDILEAIKKDHVEVMDLIAQLESKADDAQADVTETVHQFAVNLLLHAKVEQVALYTPIAQMKEEFREFALEGKIEHKLAEVTLKKLCKHVPGEDGEFKATLSVVKELVHHHAEVEEEGELFPKLEKVLEGGQRVQMAQRYADLKETMRPKIEETVTQAMNGIQGVTVDATTASTQAH